MTSPRPGATPPAANTPASGRMVEADWEAYALDELAELGWDATEGADVSPGSEKRRAWDDLILYDELRAAVERLNPELPGEAVERAVSIATTPQSREALPENRLAHHHLTAGIRLSYTDAFGAEHSPTVRLVDFRDPGANAFRAVHQVRLVDGDRERRLDVVCYVNGLPLAVAELKNASDPNADLAGAHAQLRTYTDEFPTALRHTVFWLVSDGVTAKYGTPFTPFEHFAPWNVDDYGKHPDSPDFAYSAEDRPDALGLALGGLFNQLRFLSLVRDFVNFTDTGKRIAKAHQYFAVDKARSAVVEASRTNGQAGVVWHTQGSGKSEEMVCLAGLAIREPALNNPTVVVLTDRNDLDDQLYGTFQSSRELLGTEPVRVRSREELRDILTTSATGGIVFTTLQKFGLSKEERAVKKGTRPKHPLLSERRNIVVIVDEAHRSHYDSLDGYARHLRDALPHATLLAFTGTPLSRADANTRQVFGAGNDYIDVYDLRRAVEDEATVRVYHEPRLIPVDLPPDVDPEELDREADQRTSTLDDPERDRMLKAVMQINKVYGAPDRIETLADDLVAHWENRRALVRPSLGGPGKAMIVCVSREVCVRVFDALAARRPEWVGEGPGSGVMKVVYSSDADDSAELRAHALRPSQHKAVQARAKDPDDELELLIVKDMLLTGYDAPPIHTMYMDRPMRGASLMQALARVNRRFRGKEDGLLVGYAPLTANLKAALDEYTDGDRTEEPVGRDIDRAIKEVRNEYENICAMLSGVEWRRLLTADRHRALRMTADYVIAPSSRGGDAAAGPPTEEKSLSERFRESAARLDRYYRLCSMSSEISERFTDLADWRDDIAFFAEVRNWVVKLEAAEREARGGAVPAEVRRYLDELTAAAVDAEEITDLYAEAGLGALDITRINDAQLERMQKSETPNLVVAALERLARQTMRTATRHNVISQESFTERLDALMRRYMLEQITSAQVIAELYALAEEAGKEGDRGKSFEPELTYKELAFYDAVRKSESAQRLMEDETLAKIARALVADVQKNLSNDWVSRKPVRAKLRSRVRRLLAKFDYPPEEEEGAIDLVIKQMETFAEDWTTGLAR